MRFTPIAVLLCAVLLAACQTAQSPAVVASASPGPEVIHIVFDSMGAPTTQAGCDVILLHCSEVAQSHGASHFIVKGASTEPSASLPAAAAVDIELAHGPSPTATDAAAFTEYFMGKYGPPAVDEQPVAPPVIAAAFSATAPPSPATNAVKPAADAAAPAAKPDAAPDAAGTVHVKGYFRKDGKYVQPYTRRVAKPK